MGMFLGRRPAVRGKGKCLSLFTRHLALPSPPKEVDWHAKVQNLWPMFLNDQMGDCTIAAREHFRTLWTANRYAVDGSLAQPPQIMSDAEVLSEYSRLSGYDPRTGANDNGLVVQDVMEDWTKSGGIDYRVNLNIGDLDEICDAINWFGGAYFGINCPRSALENTKLWDVVPGSPIEGGHAIMGGKYDTTYTGRRQFYIISWGMEIPVTSEFLLTYLEEAVGPISKDFVTANGKTPAGLSLEDMIANSARL